MAETIYIIVMCAWRNLRGCLCSCFVLICLFVSQPLAAESNITARYKPKRNQWIKLCKFSRIDNMLTRSISVQKVIVAFKSLKSQQTNKKEPPCHLTSSNHKELESLSWTQSAPIKHGLPPQAIHAKKTNKQLLAGSHCSGGGPNSSMACPRPPSAAKRKVDP